jgi:hypothetical protein
LTQISARDGATKDRNIHVVCNRTDTAKSAVVRCVPTGGAALDRQSQGSLPAGGAVTHYDPEVAPAPAAWLALDEQEQMQLVQAFHRAARIKLPNVKAHAAAHAIVENQIAEGLEPIVRAMARLENEGLSRHDALHAIGAVCAEHLFEILNSKREDDPGTVQARYHAAVERLTAKSWRQQYGA